MHSNHFFIHKQQVTVLAIKLSIRAKSRIKWCPLKVTQCVKEQKRYRKLGIQYILLRPLISWVTYGHVRLKEMSSPRDKERSPSSHYILRHRTIRLRCVSLQSKIVLCTTSRRLSDMTDVIQLIPSLNWRFGLYNILTNCSRTCGLGCHISVQLVHFRIELGSEPRINKASFKDCHYALQFTRNVKSQHHFTVRGPK
jgi:hypothetical protein